MMRHDTGQRCPTMHRAALLNHDARDGSQCAILGNAPMPMPSTIAPHRRGALAWGQIRRVCCTGRLRCLAQTRRVWIAPRETPHRSGYRAERAACGDRHRAATAAALIPLSPITIANGVTYTFD